LNVDPVSGQTLRGKSNPVTEIELLEIMEEGEIVTQMALSKRLLVSVGLINAMLKRSVRKGLVRAKQVPYKNYAYFLTPKGFAEKSRLVALHLENSLVFFRTARCEYEEIFARAKTGGVKRVAFAGSGDLAVIALLAAWETGVKVIGIIDRTSNKESFLGLPIERDLKDLGVADAVVVTDHQLPQATFEAIKQQIDDAQILTPDLLWIARQKPAFRPHVEAKGAAK
jgi:DNA-binding MarR family transcriptional regulator